MTDDKDKKAIQYGPYFNFYLNYHSVKVSLEIKEMMAEPIKSELESKPADPTDKAILVLNTKPFAAKPLVFDLNGEFSERN